MFCLITIRSIGALVITADSYGTIKSLFYDNFLTSIYGNPQSSGCVIGLTRKLVTIN